DALKLSILCEPFWTVKHLQVNLAKLLKRYRCFNILWNDNALYFFAFFFFAFLCLHGSISLLQYFSSFVAQAFNLLLRHRVVLYSLISVNCTNCWMIADKLIHDWLCSFWIVHLVMTIATIADKIDDKAFVEP